MKFYLAIVLAFVPSAVAGGLRVAPRLAEDGSELEQCHPYCKTPNDDWDCYINPRCPGRLEGGEKVVEAKEEEVEEDEDLEQCHPYCKTPNDDWDCYINPRCPGRLEKGNAEDVEAVAATSA